MLVDLEEFRPTSRKWTEHKEALKARVAQESGSTIVVLTFTERGFKHELVLKISISFHRKRAESEEAVEAQRKGARQAALEHKEAEKSVSLL